MDSIIVGGLEVVDGSLLAEGITICCESGNVTVADSHAQNKAQLRGKKALAVLPELPSYNATAVAEFGEAGAVKQFRTHGVATEEHRRKLAIPAQDVVIALGKKEVPPKKATDLVRCPKCRGSGLYFFANGNTDSCNICDGHGKTAQWRATTHERFIARKVASSVIDNRPVEQSEPEQRDVRADYDEAIDNLVTA